MAGQARQPHNPLARLQILRDQPYRFSWFAALRLIECAYPEYPRLGQSVKPTDDAVRLRHTPSLAFAPSEIHRFEEHESARPPSLYGLSFGLFGPNAPMPLHMTELAIGREHILKDRGLAAFADLFHHRMLSLFYRAWANAQPTVQMDRPEEDSFGFYMNALIGMATPGVEQRDAMPDQYKRFFAGRLISQARNVEGLQALLQYFFKIPVKIMEFIAEWLPLPRSSQLHLGQSVDAVGQLGCTAMPGSYVRGVQQRFRICLGPLSWPEFQYFLPGGDELNILTAAVRSYVGYEQSWDVQLLLHSKDVPGISLGRHGLLGLSTWLGRYRPEQAADQVVLHFCS